MPDGTLPVQQPGAGITPATAAVSAPSPALPNAPLIIRNDSSKPQRLALPAEVPGGGFSLVSRRQGQVLRTDGWRHEGGGMVVVPAGTVLTLAPEDPDQSFSLACTLTADTGWSTDQVPGLRILHEVEGVLADLDEPLDEVQ